MTIMSGTIVLAAFRSLARFMEIGARNYRAASADGGDRSVNTQIGSCGK